MKKYNTNNVDAKKIYVNIVHVIDLFMVFTFEQRN